MTEIKPLKLCRICKESKEASEFYTGRKECKQCKIDYQLNRYHDLKDGKRDKMSWYEADRAMDNATIIKKLEQKLPRSTGVLQVEERELRCDNDEINQDWYVFKWFFFYPAVFIFWILNGIWGWV